MPSVIRFAVLVSRLIPYTGYHHVLMMLMIVTGIFEALILAGCTSNQSTIAGIYLLSVEYSQPSQTPTAPSSSLFSQAAQGGQMIVRASYFGLCAKHVPDDDWLCGSRTYLSMLLGGATTDPLNAIGLAAHFRDEVIFPGLIIGAMALTTLTFLLLTTFPGWHEEQSAETGSDIDIKPFPSRPVTQLCLFFSLMASLFLIASALWQHVAAAAATNIISSTSQQYLDAGVGAASMTLVWLSFVLTAVVAIGLAVLISSIYLLDRLIDEQ